MSTGLGVDQLGEDECRLEQMEDQCGQIEGRVEVTVETEDHQQEWKLDRDFQKPEERRRDRCGASLSGSQSPVLRSAQGQKGDRPVQNQIDKASDHPQRMVSEVIGAERHRDERGHHDHQPDRDHRPNLTQLRDVDVATTGDAYQRSEAHEYTCDLGNGDEQDYVFQQLQPASVAYMTDYFYT